MMEVERSSSADLSSAPASDADTPNLNNGLNGLGHLSPHHNAGTAYAQKADGLQASRPLLAGSVGGASPAAGPGRQGQEQAPAATVTAATKKPARKSRAAKQKEAVPEKPVRKSRASGTTAASRKKTKTEASEQGPTIQSIAPASDLQSSHLNQPVNLHQNLNPPPAATEAAKTSQNGLSMTKQEFSTSTTNTQNTPDHAPQLHYNPDPAASVPHTQPTPPRSTPMYDPVRGHTSQRALVVEPPPPLSAPASSLVHTPPQRSGTRPSASPISSIIDPVPTQLQPSAPSPLRTFVSNSETPVISRCTETSQPPQSTQSTQSGTAAGAMDLDPPSIDLPNGKTVPANKKSAAEAPPARAASPKPARAKEQSVPVPLPTGSGLLSATLFGGESGLDSKENKITGPNIVLHIDLSDPKNKVINFARLAEEKYGFAALYPRQAAQKERLARVAAAGAALERSASASKHGGTSAGDSGEDDVSVDIDRDSDNDGDVNMGGFNGTNEPTNSGTDGPEPKRRRRKKVEEYDQDDPFIDDSEQLWETQAAASKDGFFVYSGPLVPEGEKATVERADGSVRRGGGRGRGRGGGPGSRGGRRAATTTATSAAATDADTPAARPATGPGSRGGNAARKPRAKKADRQQPQQDKDKDKRENGESEHGPAAGPAASTPTLHAASSYPPTVAQPV